MIVFLLSILVALAGMFIGLLIGVNLPDKRPEEIEPVVYRKPLTKGQSVKFFEPVSDTERWEQAEDLSGILK